MWRRRKTPRTRKVNVVRIAWVRNWCADSTNNAVANAVQGGNMRTCSKPGCERKHNAKGLCKTHYTMWRKKLITTPCRIDGCESVAYGRGWCAAHYGQFRRGLTPGERSLQCERLNVEPFLGRVRELCANQSRAKAADQLHVGEGTIYRWLHGKQHTITPEQADRLEMLTWVETEDATDVVDFASSAEGLELIKQMRGAA